MMYCGVYSTCRSKIYDQNSTKVGWGRPKYTFVT